MVEVLRELLNIGEVVRFIFMKVYVIKIEFVDFEVGDYEDWLVVYFEG